MPVYDFKCEKCGHTFNVLVSIKERDKVTCPSCRSDQVQQLITCCSVRVGAGCSPAAGTFRGG